MGEVEPACGILDVRASASALSSPLILSTLHSPTSITQSLTHLQIPAPSMHTPRHPVCPQACATRGGLPTRCHLPLDAAPQEMACPPVDAASLVLSRAASGGLPASRRCALVSLASLHYALATPGARLEMACSRGCPPRSHTSTLTHVHAHITLTQDPRRLSHGFLLAREEPIAQLATGDSVIYGNFNCITARRTSGIAESCVMSVQFRERRASLCTRFRRVDAQSRRTRSMTRKACARAVATKRNTQIAYDGRPATKGIALSSRSLCELGSQTPTYIGC